jgi:hypothetical protein
VRASTSPRTLPAANVGAPPTYALQAANIVGSPTWALGGESLPPGMTLNATGVISGTCTKKGPYHFNVHVADVSSSDTLTLGLTVK